MSNRKEPTYHSIDFIQSLIIGQSSEDAGRLLSGEESGHWCGLWYDWFCDKSELAKRASEFKEFILGLKGEFTKTHYIWLKNNCPVDGDLYDDIRISPLDENVKSYNVGYSLGNGDTRDRQVFDTRTEPITVKDVDSHQEAIDYVNFIFD